MARFIYVGSGFVNLDVIDRVERKHDGRYQLFSKGVLVDDNNVEFGRCIISEVAVSGEWECHLLCEGETGAPCTVSEPLIAWGRTADGEMKPITPSESDGVDGEYVVSRVGDPRVYGGFGANIGGWKDLSEWLQHITKDRKAVSAA